jgi:hypothetical protein
VAHQRGAALTLVAERLRAQLLSGPPAADPVDVAERLLAVQGQDARGVRLAVRARTSGLSVRDFDRALTEERSLLITWVNRGTLHLVRSEDYPWLHAVTTPRLYRPVATRLAQLGIDARTAECGVAVIERSLAADGVLTRGQLRDRLDAAGVPTAGQALIHLLMLATLHGHTVRGPIVGRQHAYVLVREWLGPSPKTDREAALGTLAHRYLVGHAPAGERDLARWAGLPLRDVRAGLGRIAAALVEREDGLLELRPRARSEPEPPPTLPPPRLLGAFDPVLLGWCTRAPITGEHDGAIISGGMFRPLALVGGRAVGRWRIDSGRVVLTPLTALRRDDQRALEADAEDVVRYLEL